MEREIGGKFCLDIQAPSVSGPWIVQQDVISQGLLVPEPSFSQAHSSLSHWMLFCSFVVLLAVIPCEGLSLSMKKGNSAWQDRPSGKFQGIPGA